MPRTCIIGGGATGSREHIFPASLGGRRTNKGIYCGNHNNAFSGLAGSLSGQLKLINSLLGVRSDHSDKAHILNFTAPNGQIWKITAGGVTKDGPTSASDDTLHMQFTLGGPDGLKAISYIALTFFAHHFPDEAREPEIQPIKRYIQSEIDNDFAWWEEPASLSKFPTNRFQFGHTIALSTNSKTGEVFAFVSLFSTLNFGIHIGKLNKCNDKTVIVFIDPHAERAPDDIFEQKTDTVDFEVAKPNPLHSHLEKMIKAKSGEGDLQRLFEKIEEWKFENEMASTLVALNGSRFLSDEEQWQQVVDVVQEQTSRVYRLLVHFARMYKKDAGQSPFHNAASKMLDAMIARDSSDPTKLTDAATYATAKAMEAIIKELKQRLSKGDIDMKDLWFLLSGTDGLKIAGAAVLDDLKEIASKI